MMPFWPSDLNLILHMVSGHELHLLPISLSTVCTKVACVLAFTGPHATPRPAWMEHRVDHPLGN